MLKIFDEEVMIYGVGFTQWSGMETQYLYYAEMKIVIDCVELNKGKTGGRSEVLRERRRERKNIKETRRNRQV